MLFKKNLASLSVNPSSVTHCIPGNILWVNRLALFLIFFWFGLLKVISLSPAESLIEDLHQIALSKFLSINSFLIILGIIECIIGIMWLIPRLTRFVIIIFIMQMLTTFLPLILLPSETWNNVMVLSLSGQYIIKNIVLIASAFTIYKDCQIRRWKILNNMRLF